jgi:hypothetical protein
VPVEAQPVSFLLDPATLARRDFDEPDVWLPVVDPGGISVAYWSGTVRSSDGLHWELGTGELVLDGWLPGTPAGPEPSDAASPGPATGSPDPSASQQPAVGPAGAATPIVPGTIAAFKARFDPSGTRLAVWVGEEAAEPVGRLHLIVIDAGTPTVDPTLTPLPGTPALRKFSIEDGRLAWITPPGQDGNASAVRVLAWQDDDFGEIEAVAGQGGQILP